MSDRTVTYTFRGNFTSLTAGLAASGRAVGDLGTKLTAADRKGAQYRRGLSSLGSAAGKAGLVAAAGIAVMVKATADFDQAMSNVTATGAATTAQLGELRKAALAAGQTTKFSATEAASGIEALLKAGVSAQDVIGGGLKGALSLAAAGELDVGAAAEDAATAMTQFKLAGTDVPHIADLLAAGAGKAQGDVADLAEALKAGGLTASQFGVSINDTVGTLTAFAAAGLLGSTSGTVLKQMLLKLAAPSVKAAKTMADLGISAYDASGKFVGFTALAGELQAQLGGLTGEQRNAALATIFGSRAIQGANVLYADGAQGVADWTSKVNDQGYATKVAAARLDNLSGDLHKFKSALDVAFIGQGEGTQGPLRNLVQGATDATNAFNHLPASVHSSANALLTLTAITGGGLWFTTKSIGAVGAMNSALKNLGVSSQVTAKGLAKAAGAFAALEVAGQGLNALIQSTREALPGTQELTAELLSLTTEVQTMSNVVGETKLNSKFDDIGASIKRIADPGTATAISDHAAAISNVATSIIGLHSQAGTLTRAKDEIDALDAALANIATSGSTDQAKAAFDALAQSQGLSATQQAELLKLMPQYQEALAGASNSAVLASGGVDQLAASAESNKKAQDDQTAAINKANQAMKKQHDDALSAFDAETQYRQAVKDATAQANKSNDGIRGNTDAALANRSALSGLSSAWNSQSAAVKNNVGRYKEAKANFIQTAEAMGVPKKAAQELANQLLQIPRSTVAKVTADTAAAHTAINGVVYDLAHLHDKTVYLNLVTRRSGAGGQGNGFGAYDSGGYTGDGGKYDVAGVVHRGEVVIPQAEVHRDWGMLKARYGHLPGFADGGKVGGSTKPGNTYAAGNDQTFLAFVKGIDTATTSLASLHIAADAEAKRLTKAKSTLSSDTSARDSLASTISSALGLDSAFAQSQASSNPWAASASAGGGYNVTGNSNQIYASATAELADIKSLQAKGVSGAALQAIISQGPELVHALAQMSPADLSGAVSAYSAASAAVAAVATYGANAVDGGTIARDQKHLDQIRDQVRALRHEMAQYAKDNKQGHKHTADAAANSGNKAATQAKQRTRGKP